MKPGKKLKSFLHSRLEKKDQMKYEKAAQPYYKAQNKYENSPDRLVDIFSKTSIREEESTRNGKVLPKKISTPEYSYPSGWQSPQGGVDVLSEPSASMSTSTSVKDAFGKFSVTDSDSGQSFIERSTKTPTGNIVDRRTHTSGNKYHGKSYPAMPEAGLRARNFNFINGKSTVPTDMGLLELLKRNLKL